MACFKPLQAYKKENGEILFHDTGHGRPIEIPCGQCIGCRLSRSREWATRCVHEAQLHDNNCFITLTYNPENLPPDCGLVKNDFVKFMKRARKYIEKEYGKQIKFYQCGEYGDNNNRPHYHAILFGFNFPDWVYLFDSNAGVPIYSSPTLEKIWGLGFVTIGECNFQSAAYIARYCVKKINGPKRDQINEKTGLKHYERINSFTGEISAVVPEYSTMSRGGRSGHGIAHDWITTFSRDVYPKDFTTINGIRMPSTKYYDRYINSIDPELYDDIKAGRELNGYLNTDNTTERLKARETVKLAQNSQLRRSL